MERESQELGSGRPLTLRSLLREGAQMLRAAGVDGARLDAEVLLGHSLGWEKAELYLRLDTVSDAEAERRFRSALLRRARREPVAYITGCKEFWSRELAVAPAVLIPRPETELLVEIAVERARQISDPSRLKILDLGTGSGAIAVCLAKELPGAQICAVDVSAAALAISRINSARHGVADRIRLLRGDLFEPLARDREAFDLIASNPPYIPSSELPYLAPEIRDWEPRSALDGGADGLDFYRRIIGEAHNYLGVGGQLLLEIGDGMGEALRRLLVSSGHYGSLSLHRDYSGNERVIAAGKIRSPGGSERG